MTIFSVPFQLQWYNCTSMRILVVEDEHKIANSIKKGLEQESYAVDVMYDGESGFDLASSEEYDLIILDLMLPGMNGITFCKKLREQQIHTPIIMLTAKGQTEDKVNGLDSGADDYLTKPFAFAELVARVRALNRRPKKNTGTILTVGDLQIDTVNYQVLRGEKDIALSSKEFSLLEYLVRHKNKVITKEQIMNHVWDYDADVLPNSVEVYILHIRNKIDKAFKDKKPLIHTIRGFGYKISD
jgi:DNA-binding response OmpR family regulator